MLEDMGDAIRAVRKGLEGKAKEIFRVAVCDMKDPCARRFVDELDQRTLQLRERQVLCDHEVPINLPFGRKSLDHIPSLRQKSI